MPKREPRLQFSDEERADPVLGKAVRKADKAAGKADAAQAKIPKKTVKVKDYRPDPQRAVSERTGAGGVRQNSGRKSPG